MQWYCRLSMKKKCSGLIILQLDSLVWETVSHRTHKPKIVDESLKKGALIGACNNPPSLARAQAPCTHKVGM